MSWIRLRQVALVTSDLEAVIEELHESFGLEVAFRDPAVARFGLRNAVLPVGNQFLELVSPTRQGTAGGRQLERLGGDGGYMVICHTDEHAPLRAWVDDLGIRKVIDVDDHGYRIMQLHPGDTGGSFLEIDFQPGGDDPEGPWMPAGEDWQRFRRTGTVRGLAGVTVQSRDQAGTAERWGRICRRAVEDGVLPLDNASVTFAAGAIDSLVGVTLVGADPTVSFDTTIAGVSFSVG